MAAIMLQTIRGFYVKISENVFLFLQKHMKNTLFVKTTASTITTTKRVFYPLVIITFYYFEKMRNRCINWIDFVSPINTWTVYIPCSSTAPMERIVQRVDMCLTMYTGSSALAKEKTEWTNCQVLQKRGSWEKCLNSTLWVLSKRTNQRRPVVQSLQKELKKPERLNLNWK